MKSILQIVYTSSAADGFPECELSELRKQWRSSNEKRDIGSVLVHFDGSFLQLLEGERSMVEAVYKLIREDCRHTQITHVGREIVRDRSFDGLSLAYAALHPRDARELFSANDQMPPGPGLEGIDVERAKILLFGALDKRRGLPQRFSRSATTWLSANWFPPAHRP
jgi:hypothetical protein